MRIDTVAKSLDRIAADVRKVKYGLITTSALTVKGKKVLRARLDMILGSLGKAQFTLDKTQYYTDKYLISLGYLPDR